jgi:hypothetical protein
MSEGFVFIYMFPASAVRDVTITPILWMKRVLAELRMQWFAYAEIRLPYIVWAQLLAQICEEFNGWTPPVVIASDDESDSCSMD